MSGGLCPGDVSRGVCVCLEGVCVQGLCVYRGGVCLGGVSQHALGRGCVCPVHAGIHTPPRGQNDRRL